MINTNTKVNKYKVPLSSENSFSYRFSVNTALKNMVWNKEYDGATHGVSNKMKNQIQV